MTIPIEILKIEDYLRCGYHILCRVHINGKEFRTLIDTGSSTTVFNINKAKEISTNKTESNKQKMTTVNGSIKSKYLTIDEIRIGDTIIKDYKIILIDLEHINKHFRNNGKSLIDGIIGGDILFEYKAIIDYDKRILILNI